MAALGDDSRPALSSGRPGANGDVSRTDSVRRSTRRGLILVLVLAALGRTGGYLASGLDGARRLERDSQAYLALERELLAGHGFGRPHVLREGQAPRWMPELFRTPGYPALLAGVALLGLPVAGGVTAVQNLLGVAMCGGLYVLGARRFGRRAALALGLLSATDFQAVALANKVLTDFPFTVLLVVALALAAGLLGRPGRRRAVVLATLLAIVLGLGAWVRPAGIALPSLAGGVLLLTAWRRRRRRLVLAGAIVAVLGNGIIGGWILRNGLVCGQYVLTSVSRYNHVAYYGAHTLSRARDIPTVDARRQLCERIGLTSHEVLHRALSRQESRRLRATVNAVIAEHPRAFVRVSAGNAVNLLAGPDKRILSILGWPMSSFGLLGPSSGQAMAPMAVGLLAFETLWLLTVYALVIRGLVRACRGRRLGALAWLSLVMAAYLLLISIGPMSDPRMRAPAIGPLLLVAGAGLAGKKSPADRAASGAGKPGENRGTLPIFSLTREGNMGNVP